MSNGYRFGRRMTLPSTVQIKHELRMMILADSIDALQQEQTALEVADGKAPDPATVPEQKIPHLPSS
ncbi:MAG: hypothetical protein P4L82_05500 [Ancalomicrobiaceae bacterium]|nr:hypothetical protein [Ancalomicrobiaceae bacterium]